jgi:hypothetical protein
MKSADLRPWPSVLNAFQARNQPHDEKRSALLAAIADLAGDLPLLPLAEVIVRESAHAAVDGTQLLTISAGLGEKLILDPEAPLPAEIADVSKSLAELDELQEDTFRSMRPEVRALIKAAEGALPWATLPAFLEKQWMTETQLADILLAESERFGLARPLTYSEVLSSSILRLHFESFGAAMYQRVLLADEGKRVQATDLMQLPYLGARPRRILVTEDRSFLHLARAVVNGRYPLARVMSWEEFATANGL